MTMPGHSAMTTEQADEIARDVFGVLLLLSFTKRPQRGVYTCKECGALERKGRDCMVCDMRGQLQRAAG
jgi:hypothetical protein